MYTDIYNTYDNVTFEYDYPISFATRTESYLENENPPFATWAQGDTQTIAFKVSPPTGITLSSMQITLNLYNFRRELIDSFTNALGGILTVDDTDNKIYWPINKTLSASIDKGIYYCGIVGEYSSNVITLVDDNISILYVN